MRQVRTRKLEQLALIGAHAFLENNKGVRRLAPAFRSDPLSETIRLRIPKVAS
jgi:hypothetical protein